MVGSGLMGPDEGQNSVDAWLFEWGITRRGVVVPGGMVAHTNLPDDAP